MPRTVWVILQRVSTKQVQILPRNGSGDLQVNAQHGNEQRGRESG